MPSAVSGDSAEISASSELVDGCALLRWVPSAYLMLRLVMALLLQSSTGCVGSNSAMLGDSRATHMRLLRDLVWREERQSVLVRLSQLNPLSHSAVETGSVRTRSIKERRLL